MTDLGEEQYVRIGAIYYKISELERLRDEGSAQSLFGEIVYSKATISLESAMNPQAKRATLWHEIIHGILQNAGIHKHDETIVNAISLGVMQVLEDNPWLAERPALTT